MGAARTLVSKVHIATWISLLGDMRTQWHDNNIWGVFESSWALYRIYNLFNAGSIILRWPEFMIRLSSPTGSRCIYELVMSLRRQY